MNWLFDKKIHTSPQNGTIVVRRNFGIWEVAVGNSIQTNDYTQAMFAEAFRRIAARVDAVAVHSVLMLGLGGGSAIKPLHQTFPTCSLLSIEYDPEMIAITKEIGLYKPFPFPQVIKDDAGIAIKNVRGLFNLIIIDLFIERQPSPLLSDNSFIDSVRTHLHEKGILLVNVSKHPEYLERLIQVFPQHDIWNYKSNTLGTFIVK